MLENKRAETLRLLRESGKNVSGQELCEHFGISRTAVWKMMNQLKEEGYEIEAVQNKGYRLLNEPDLVTSLSGYHRAFSHSAPRRSAI